MAQFLLSERTRNNATTAKHSHSGKLASQVRDRLHESGYLALHEISCEVRDGVAYLHGQLRSQYHKQLAQAAALEVHGIGRVENRIEIDSVRVVARSRRFGAA